MVLAPCGKVREGSILTELTPVAQPFVTLVTSKTIFTDKNPACFTPPVEPRSIALKGCAAVPLTGIGIPGTAEVVGAKGMLRAITAPTITTNTVAVLINILRFCPGSQYPFQDLSLAQKVNVCRY